MLMFSRNLDTREVVAGRSKLIAWIPPASSRPPDKLSLRILQHQLAFIIAKAGGF